MIGILRGAAIAALICLGVAVAAALILLEDRPRIAAMAAPTSQDVAAVRTLVHRARAALAPGSAEAGRVAASDEELRSLVRLGARVIPGFRGEVATAEGRVSGAVSVPVPHTGGARWLNLAATLPAFAGRPALSDVRVGAVRLPPDAALSAARIGANLVLGDRFGDRALDAVGALQVAPGGVRVDFDLDEMGRNGLMRSLFGAMRGADLPGRQDVARYYRLIRDAMERGDLPVEGSFLPYLRFALAAALERSGEEGAANAYTSALFALARICGAKDFSLVVGGVLGGYLDGGRRWATDCGALTLNGRVDTRRHFITAAALQAASNRGFAISVGEFKELYDSVKAGGFDFTDLAANNSGIRMSNRFMSMPAATWPGLLDRIRQEADAIIAFDDLPALMPEAEFRAIYGSVDSPAYHEMLDRIERRIDRLPLYASGR